MSYENEDLRAEELAEGVWALLAKPNGALAANCALVDLGGTTVAWDTGGTPLGGASVRAAAVALTGRPPDLLILSHPHPDHQGGAAWLPESTYISSAKSRAVLERAGINQLVGMRGNVGRMLAAAQERSAGETDPAKQQEASAAVAGLTRVLNGFPEEPQVRMPVLTVESSFTLQGSRRRAEFQVLGNGHSPSDGVLLLPEDGIVLSGDVALPAGNLFLNVGGDERVWPEELDRLLELGAERLVPGHGPVAPVAGAVEISRAYLTAILGALEEAIAAGKGPEWAERCPVPAPWLEMAWRRNLKGLLTARLA